MLHRGWKWKKISKNGSREGKSLIDAILWGNSVGLTMSGDKALKWIFGLNGGNLINHYGGDNHVGVMIPSGILEQGEVLVC
jgi:hypothetical protein